ncbi:unnamed protein product [Heligmosomoides polygyrus]|uniref:Uncharacterized protein n=1 Tax=Heligmosomoides polygyrus TaxID=6339 RepID=A0A3P8C486_HELPZ|nr:unnamed protein product [Heligmosomoides polygyrus]
MGKQGVDNEETKIASQAGPSAGIVRLLDAVVATLPSSSSPRETDHPTDRQCAWIGEQKTCRRRQNVRSASPWIIHREEVMESLLRGDNDLHQSVVKALDGYNRVSETFGDDYSDATDGLGTST